MPSVLILPTLALPSKGGDKNQVSKRKPPAESPSPAGEGWVMEIKIISLRAS